MNKILVIKDNITPKYQDNITIIGNNITFNENGEYSLFYVDCNKVNLNIEVKENVYIKLVEYSNNNNIEINNTYLLNEKANVLLYKFYSNNNTKEKVTINLEGKYAKFNYNFTSICKNEDIYNIIINHNEENTISNVINKCITLDNGKSDFTIDSYLPKGKTNCYLNQDTKIITMKENNSIIRPNMYIEEFDVEAKHSSRIGSFDDKEIFYLLTRGINQKEAIKLLVKGFIFSNLMVDLEIREKILKIINTYWR